MNAVEEIQAAIEKLTELKGSTSRAAWSAWRMYTPSRGAIYGLEDSDANDLVFTRTPQDAELVEVLHRTIDAQLALLTIGQRIMEHFATGNGSPLDEHRAILALAHAINGGTA